MGGSVMSEQTSKLAGWTPQGRPAEDDDMKFHRQMIVEIVFGLFFRKKEILAEMGMPSQPVSLLEIWREYRSRVTQLKAMKLWRCKEHGKRWLDRRVNECACPKYYENGVAKIVATTAGFYEPNPMLFGDVLIHQLNNMAKPKRRAYIKSKAV